MIEIDCTCCGAELERHERWPVPMSLCLCEACTIELDAIELHSGVGEIEQAQPYLH